MRVFRIASAIVVGFAALTAIDTLCVVPYRCNQITKVGGTAVAAALSGNPSARLFLRDQAPSFDRCIARQPQNVELQLLRGTTQSLFGDYEGALATYQRALRYDRRPEIYFDIGGALMRLRRTEEAIDSYAIAVRFNPELLVRISDPLIRSRVETRTASAGISID